MDEHWQLCRECHFLSFFIVLLEKKQLNGKINGTIIRKTLQQGHVNSGGEVSS